MYYTKRQLDVLYKKTIRCIIQKDNYMCYTKRQLDVLYKKTIRSIIPKDN